MYCINCGKDIEPNMTFCPACGAPAQNTNQPLAPQPAQEAYQQPMVQENTQPNVNVPLTNNDQMVQPMMSQPAPMSGEMPTPVQPVQQVPVQQPVPMQPVQQVPVAQPLSVNNPNGVVNPTVVEPDKNNNKVIILLGVVIILFLIIIIILFSRNNSKNGGNDPENKAAASRTILVYLCGSDLEEKLALASNDLAGVDPAQVDLETTNVVVYTGGATEWHNYISPHENAIYVLTETGFVKKETYEKASMGVSDSLLTLLDYGYDNYKADKYDLVMWNHGLGALGISSDTNFGHDYLSLNEITSALEKSNFGGKNKFETVLFRSCLNATIEVATVFVPYANYLVASEEVTWGGRESNILGFINDIELEHDGKTIGTNFIKYYENTLTNLANKYYGTTLDEVFPESTYSILDLTKLASLQKNLGLFVEDINLDLNYNVVAKVRSNASQYGGEVVEYDTVDLYELVSGLKSLSPGKAQNLLDSLEDVVVYNWTNTDFSKGLSVYFPYKGSTRYRTYHKTNYKNLKPLGDYYTFIYYFSNLQSKANSGGFSAISKENIDLKVENKKATLILNDTNVDNYAKVSYQIFEKVNNTDFNLVYESNTIELKKNTFEVNLYFKLIKLGNNTLAIEAVDDDTFTTNVSVVDGTDTITGKLYLNVKDNKVIGTKIVPTSSELSSGYALSAMDYKDVTYMKNTYTILQNGVEKDKWDVPVANKIVGTNTGYSLVDLTNDYYIVFKIYDVDNLYTYSKLTKIN